MYAGPDGNPDAAICSRIESDKQVGNENAGWLHILHHDEDWRIDDFGCIPERRPRRQTATIRSSAPPTLTVEFLESVAAEYVLALDRERESRLCESLGVSGRSLNRLQMGWSNWQQAFTLPMRAADGNPTGIRFRGVDGRKWSLKGGREGLFIPVDLQFSRWDDEYHQLLICEGPTDCAALLDLGFAAVGRPNCTGGVKQLIGLVADLQPREVVIVADADPPGLRGAKALAVELVSHCRGVKTILPPDGIKDVRDWVRDGAERFDIQATIDRASILTLRVESREVGR